MAIDKSYGHTTQKENQNLLSLTYDGRLKDILYGEAVFNPANLVDGAGVTTTVTVRGAALGDMVLGVSFGVDLQGITVTAYVSAANTVAVRFQNETTGALDLASATLRVIVADIT